MNNAKGMIMLRLLCKMVNKRMVKLLFILILALRISLFSLPSFQIDMNNLKSWTERLVEIGPYNFFSGNYFSNSFPGYLYIGYLYILWIVGSIFYFIFPFISFNSLMFEGVLKSITTLFDIGTAFYIYKIVHKYNPKLSSIAALLYLSNPAVIFNSSIWGQIDGIFTFFLVYASYSLLEKRSILKWNFSTAFAVLMKPQSLAGFPIMFAYFLKNFKKNLVIENLLLFPLSIIIFSIPFFLKDPILGLAKLLYKSVNFYPFTSLFAFNFWSIFNWWTLDLQKVFTFSYRDWGIIIYLFSLLSIIIPLLRKKITPQLFYFASSLSFLVFFLFLTRVHERYLFPFLAFILIAALIKKSKFLFSIYIISSIVHFINLWFVYYYYNFVYNNPNFASNIFYRFINENYKFFSILMVVSYVSLLIFYYKSYAKKT